jgi:hypothetical protein
MSTQVKQKSFLKIQTITEMRRRLKKNWGKTTTTKEKLVLENIANYSASMFHSISTKCTTTEFTLLRCTVCALPPAGLLQSFIAFILLVS